MELSKLIFIFAPTITGTSFVGGVAGQTMNCTMTTCNAATTITSSGAEGSLDPASRRYNWDWDDDDDDE